MKIIVTGGAGFLGSRLIEALLRARDGGQQAVPAFETILSLDLAPARTDDPRVTSLVGDVADPAFIGTAVNGEVAAVYHLAAVVSGQAEAEFDTGMRVNVDGLRHLLDACRKLPAAPRFVFASSLAVFGGPMPEVVPESQVLTPRSSYGAQKAIGELLVGDYARKGFVHGMALRLPTVVVRPGKPNAAASSFASSIIREPLAGLPAVCPVPLDTRMWLSSPDAVVDNLVHALTLDTAALEGMTSLNLPGITVTVGGMLDALERIGGAAARRLVSETADERIAAIVCGWPGAFDVTRARRLGFRNDVDFDAVIERYIEANAPGRQ